MKRWSWHIHDKFTKEKGRFPTSTLSFRPIVEIFAFDNAIGWKFVKIGFAVITIDYNSFGRYEFTADPTFSSFTLDTKMKSFMLKNLNELDQK